MGQKLFERGNRDAYLNDQKHFNQNYEMAFYQDIYKVTIRIFGIIKVKKKKLLI